MPHDKEADLWFSLKPRRQVSVLAGAYRRARFNSTLQKAIFAPFCTRLLGRVEDLAEVHIEPFGVSKLRKAISCRSAMWQARCSNGNL
jgi:hypothetical protein